MASDFWVTKDARFSSSFVIIEARETERGKEAVSESSTL
jgi:hypothetical protein